MKYYKNPENGDVFAYEEDGSQDAFIPPYLVQMTPEEVYAHLNPPPYVFSRAEIENLRLGAYADPYSGSDRHFVEHLREQLMGNDAAAELAKQAGIARANEIRLQYPWPVTP
jgi:hypothetical protein